MKKIQRKIVVLGHILSSKKKKGIQNLSVFIHSINKTGEPIIGSTLTDEKGEFKLILPSKEKNDIFLEKPSLLISVQDSSGKTIFKSRKAKSLKEVKQKPFKILIPASRHVNHNQQGVKILPRLAGGVVDSKKLDTINRALALLQSYKNVGRNLGSNPSYPGSHRGVQTASIAAYCPAPGLIGFGDLVKSAWDVIDNSPLAIPDYVDRLEVLVYRKEVRATERLKAVSQRWQQSEIENPQKVFQVIEDKRLALRNRPLDTLIEKERILPVLVAAVIAAGDDVARGNRYLSVLLGEMGALSELDIVYRSAVDAFKSNPVGLGGFSDILSHIGGTCGPADGPVFVPPDLSDIMDTFDLGRLEQWHCTSDMIIARRTGALSAESYHIERVEWSDGCPGSTVVISGINFGSSSTLFGEHHSRRVLFTHQTGIGYTEAVPASLTADWTDTRIEVTIPEEAGPGPVSLHILDHTVTICGMGIPIYRRGNEVSFSGGAAFIRIFTANSQRGVVQVPPGETATLRWLVVPASADVRLHIEQDGVVILNEGVPADGSRGIPIPAGSPSETFCTLTSNNHCIGSHIRTIRLISCEIAELAINGIEVTQAIQYYHSNDHLADAADVKTDNSAQLVAFKPAWVRVYLRSGLPVSFNGGQLPDIDGSLVIERRVDGVWSNVTTLHAINAPFTAEASFPTHHLERNDIDSSLNFIIPAHVMTGLLRLTVTASSTSQCAGLPVTESMSVDVNLQQQLQVAALRIGYDGLNAAGTANVTFAAPPLNGVGNTVVAECDFALSIYPVSSVLSLRDLGTEDATAPLNDTAIPAGACDANWSSIITLVANARTNDGNQPGWVYFGFVTDNIPLVHGNIGCASGTNAAGIVGSDPAVFAHEAGHQMGLPHSPCGVVGTPNASYPMYEPYDTGFTTVNPSGNTVFHDASIGEYGLDINNGDIYPPNTSEDFMSYCDPKWVSLYSHDYMTNNDLLNPLSLATGFSGMLGGMADGNGASKDSRSNSPQPRITITGFVDSVGKFFVSNVARMKVWPILMNGKVTTYEAQIIGDSGQPVSVAPVFTLPHRFHYSGQSGGSTIYSEQDQSAFHFIAILDDIADGQALQIVKGGEIVWRKKSPARKPKLHPVKASLNENNRLELFWSFDVPPEQEAQIWLRWSRDKGKTWNNLAVNRKGTSASLPIDGLPAGVLVFQVVAHDGFYSVSAESQGVEVPERAPLLSILRPREGTPVTANLPLRLLSSVTIRSENTLTEKQFIWYIDDQEVGRGPDIWVKNPGQGKHEIRLVAKDPVGAAEVRATIEIMAKRSNKKG